MSVLQNEKSAVSSRHERRKYHQQAAFDSPREPTADELAGGGRGTTDRGRPSGAGDLGAGRAFGFESILRRHREQRGRRWSASVRSTTANQSVGVCLQPGDWLGAGGGATLRI